MVVLLGCIVIGFDFKIKTKRKKRNITSERDPDTPDMFHKLTDKQVNYYGAKLANDDVFGSRYAKTGKDKGVSENLIKQLLTNPDNQQKWLNELQCVGYKL